MRKTIICIGLIAAMSISFTACSENTSTPASNESTTTTTVVVESTTEAPTESTLDFDGSAYTEIGDGDVYISTSGGTSEGGNIPVIFVSKDTLLDQIEVDVWETDHTHLGYVYIDGMLIDKQQLGDVQFTIDLTGNSLKEGTHKVEVVLYDNDQPDGNIILYRSSQYECKLR